MATATAASSSSVRRQLLRLILIMVCVALAVGGISIWLLYSAAFEEQRARLVEAAQSQARLIEAVARFDAKYSRSDYPGDAEAATLSQIVDAHERYAGFGESGEFTLAKRVDDRIVFLLRHRHFDLDKPKPVPWDAALAEPMRRALSGHSGTIVGLDYRGVRVLAAHEPVAVLDTGIVAKIDLAEINAPFIKAAIASAIGAMIIVLLGAALFRRVSAPIIERENAEQALRESEERFSAVFDNSPSAIYFKDTERRYRMVNKRFQEWFGVSAADAVGKTAADIHPKELADQYDSYDNEILASRQPSRRETETAFAEGSFHTVMVTRFPVFDAAGRMIGIGGISTDVTEQHRIEGQLRESQKMAAVGQLTGGVAHEFNNLLMVVTGNLELLQEGLPDDHRLRRYASLATKGAMRGAELTQSLLAYSRKQTLAKDRFDLNHLVLKVTDMLRRTLGETVTLETDLTTRSCQVFADSGQLEGALINLVVNARDAMPDGGTIVVGTATTTIDSKAGDVEAGNYAVLEVTDSGTGMDAETIERAFEPFFTTKGLSEGTGLGLSMVYGFAKQSGGFAEIDSELGRGTAVRLCLPLARQQSADSAKTERHGGGIPALREPTRSPASAEVHSEA